MFETTDAAKQQILKDKHTLLEGYVTEYLFEKQFLTTIGPKYTSGWWSAERDNQRFFFLVKDRKNSVDERIFDILSKRYKCWLAYPDGNTWMFSDDSTKLSENEFVHHHSLTVLRPDLLATQDTRNRNRQNQCVSFFEKKGIIRKIAIERHFADAFLTRYFERVVNIDYVTEKSNGNLCVIEVKFKYEDRSEHFGINAGQVSMLAGLEELGFEICHAILYNHKKDKNLSVFGFLQLPDEKTWLIGRLSGFSNRRFNQAPRETSVDGRHTQAYYSFAMNEVSHRVPLKI